MIEHNNNTNVTLDRLFNELYNMISECNRIPLTDKIIIEESDLAGMLDDLKEAIPKEVKNAGQVLEEQKSIVNKAYEEADRIVQQAKDEAERIVGAASAEADRKVQEEEIVKQANAVAEDIKASALRYQEEIKREADDYAQRAKLDSLQYADEMMAYLGSKLQPVLQDLAETRAGINEERQKWSRSPRPADETLDEMTEE